MKRKKLWITLASVVIGLFVVCLAVHFLTKLSSVSVEFRDRLFDGTRLEVGILDKVKEDGEFNYKKSVLFTNTKESVDRIEKENPYVKVRQVIRKFPNKICIYISERVPRYRVADSTISGQWYILDDDFKVLDIATNSELAAKDYLTKTIEVQHIKFTKHAVGEFLAETEELSRLNDIADGVYGKTKDYFAVTAIDFDLETSTFSLTMRATDLSYNGGCVIKIIGTSNLTAKSFKATCAYVDKNLEDINLNEKVIIISDDDGCRLG